MSKYVKYISNTHTGAPVIKGDRYGYLIELLRTALCTGFNERSDITKIEALTENTFKIYFFSDHGYTVNQTIQLKNSYIDEFNGEHVVISNTATEIIVESYVNNLTPMIDSVFDGFNNVSIKVAPLGFIESFKEGDRSVFTTDEREAYLYVDDRTPPGWIESGGRTPPCTPIVAMTDNMVDIDTMGQFVVPRIASNPSLTTNPNHNWGGRRVGLWNWISFGTYNSNEMYQNTAAQRTTIQEYEIVGNGRMVYLIINVRNYSYFGRIVYCFGKINSEFKHNQAHLNYILKASSPPSNYNTWHYVNVYHDYSNLPFNGVNTTYYGIGYETGQNGQGLLKYNNVPQNVYYSPTMGWTSEATVSGSGSTFPNPTTDKMHISDINVFANSLDRYAGKMSGLKWIYHNYNVVLESNKINTFVFGGGYKKIYFVRFVGRSTNGISSSTSNTYTYGISLDYKDWYNYD